MPKTIIAPAELIDSTILLRESMRRITRAISSRLPSFDTLNLIVEEARQMTGSSTIALGLLEADERLRFVAVAGSRTNELVGMSIRVEDSFAEETIRTGALVLLTESEVRATSVHRDGIGGTLASVPVYCAGDTIGALCGMSDEISADMELLSFYADQVALAIVADETERIRLEQERELTVLHSAADVISSSLNVQEVMNSVLDAICNHLDYQTAVLFLLNDERTHLFVSADRGLAEADREIQLSTASSVTSKVVSTGKPMIISDMEVEREFEYFTSHIRIRSAMIAPVRNRADMLGVVIVTSSQPDNFTENDLKLLDTVASQAGIAIGNAWLYEEATRGAREARALYDLSQQVGSTLQVERVLEFVADRVVNLLSVDKFALLMFDDREERLVNKVCRGVDKNAFGTIRLRPGEGVAGWVYEWMTPTAIADVAADPRNRTSPIHQEGVVSLLAVPLAVGETSMGVMMAMSSWRRLFTVGEMELLYTVANQAAVAIANARLYAKTRTRSLEMRRYFGRVARALGAAVQSGEVAQLFANLVLQMVGADRAAVYRVETEVIRLQATAQLKGTFQPDSTVPLGEGKVGWVAKRGRLLALKDAASDQRFDSNASQSRDRDGAYLGIPIKQGRRTVGVVEAFFADKREFDDDEIRAITRFARHARLADRLANLLEEK